VNDKATAAAAALRQAGVQRLFGVTGSGFSLSLIAAFEAAGGTYFAASHEAAAAIMAGASAKTGGGIGAAITIKGPGFANAMPGQLSNLYENLPVIGISEAYAADHGGRAHKLLDQRRASRQFVKAYGSLGDPSALIPKLAAIATEESPGPVHLDVPSKDESRLDRFLTVTQPSALAPSDLDAIRSAERPIVIAGSLAVRREWTAALASLGIPVFTTVAAKGAVDESLPHAAGIYTGDGLDHSIERRLLPRADAVVALGLRSGEALTPRPFGVPALNLDDVDNAADGFGMTTRSANRMDDVWSAFASKSWGADEVRAAKNALRAHLLRASWTPASAIASLQEHAAQGRLVSDTGLFCTAAEHVWESRTPLDMLLSANGRFMGTGVPMAIGACAADRSRPVICLLGDGGLPVGIPELRLVIDESFAMLIVLMTDGGYGSVAGPAGFAARSARATEMRSPSWSRVAAAAGIPSAQATSLDAFTRAAASWDRRSPFFIEASFEASTYARATAGVR